MKYNDKEQWIQSEGVWIGLGAAFIALGLTVYLKILMEAGTWYYSIILGLIFIGFAIYSRKQAEKIKE